MSTSLAFRMQRLDRIRQAPLWQSLFVFDKGKITTEVAIRSSVGIVIPLILGAVFHVQASARSERLAP